jgi:hypothetical protein
MFERFTDRARRVVVLGQEEARLLNHNYIGTEHILLGLVHEGEGVAAQALESIGISLSSVRNEVEEIIGRGQETPTGHIPFTPRAKKVLELSLREALQLGHDYIGTEHILLGLIREGEGVGAQVLRKLGADLVHVRLKVVDILEGRGDIEQRRVSVRRSLLADLLAEGEQGPIQPEELPAAVRELLERGERFRFLAARMLSDSQMDVTRAMDVVLGMLVDPERLRRTEQRFEIRPPGSDQADEETDSTEEPNGSDPPAEAPRSPFG